MEHSANRPIPNHSREPVMSIENSFLATLTENPELVADLEVKPEELSPDAAAILRVVLKIIEAGEKPDFVLIGERLESETGERWGERLYEILSAVSIPTNFSAYQDAIKKSRRKAKLVHVAERFIEQVRGGELETGKFISEIQQIESGEVQGVSKIGDHYAEIVKRVEDIRKGIRPKTIPTGIRELDKITQGLNRGDSIIIAARTSIGKTAFMCNLAVNARAPVGIISGEQPAVQITERVLARMAGISAHRLRTGQLSMHELPRLQEVRQRIEASPIHVVDIPRPSIDRIEQIARSLVLKHGIKALFIDYLQLIHNNAYTEKRLQVADISARCKALARTLDIPIVTLAQLNRNAENHEPTLSDLKESGSIEEDADIVILLYPHKVQGQLVVAVKKNRHGPRTHFEVKWNPDQMRVEDL